MLHSGLCATCGQTCGAVRALRTSLLITRAFLKLVSEERTSEATAWSNKLAHNHKSPCNQPAIDALPHVHPRRVTNTATLYALHLPG